MLFVFERLEYCLYAVCVLFMYIVCLLFVFAPIFFFVYRDINIKQAQATCVHEIATEQNTEKTQGLSLQNSRHARFEDDKKIKTPRLHRFRKDISTIPLQYKSVFGHRTRRKTNPDGHVYVIPYNIHNIPIIFIDLYIMYVLYFIIYYDTLAISYSHHR